MSSPMSPSPTPYSFMMAARFVREQAERYLAGKPLANVITGDY